MSGTTAQKRAERERKRAAGLVKVEVWVRQEHAENVRNFAKWCAVMSPDEKHTFEIEASANLVRACFDR